MGEMKIMEGKLKNRECFRNDAELCFYLDGEITYARRIALDEHVACCDSCASRLQSWKQMKSLVRRSASRAKAPAHMRERLANLMGIEEKHEAVVVSQKITPNPGSEHMSHSGRASYGIMAEFPFLLPQISLTEMQLPQVGGPPKNVEDF